jgi:outer membrane murein-binding lipoprotein Lpp
MGEEGVKRVMDAAWRNPLAAAGIGAALISGAVAATTIYNKIDQVGEDIVKMNAAFTKRLDDLERDKNAMLLQIGKIERDQTWMAKTLERSNGQPSSVYPQRSPQ